MNKCFLNSLVIAIVLLIPCMVFALPGAHDPSSGNLISCGSCHTSGSLVGNTDSTYAKNVCLRCHSSGGAITSTTDKKFAAEDYSNPFGTIDTQILAPPSKPLQTSHKWFGPDIVPAAGAVKPVDVDSQGLNKNVNFVNGGLFCARCHNVHGTSGLQSNSSPYLRYANDQDQLCLNCHRPRDQRDHRVGTHPVNVSYTSATAKVKKAAGTLLDNPISVTNNVAGKLSQVKLVNSKVVCSTCHKTHNADSKSSTFDPYSTSHTFGNLSSSNGSLLRVDAKGKTASDLNICTNCHAGPNGYKNHNLGLRGSKAAVQCNDCHSGHVEYDPTSVVAEKVPNVNLVRRFLQYSTNGRVNKRILNRSTTTEYYNATGNGVCQSCHNPPADHYTGETYSGSFPKTGYTLCNDCHKHAETTGAFSLGAGACNSCHGNPPSAATTTLSEATAYTTATTRSDAASPHMSHAGGGADYSFSCSQCHNGYSTTHKNSNYSDGVFVTKVPVVAGGNIAGSNASYVGSTTVCSNIYCHSNGQATTSTGSATWFSNFAGGGSFTPATCASCHAASPVTGSHTPHATRGYGCATCHAGTLLTDTTVNVAGGKHVNAAKDVQFSGVTPAAGASCSVVVCHGGAIGGPVDTPVWGGGSTLGDCGSCHLTGTSAPLLATGTHTAHLAAIAGNDPAVECAKCHTYTTTTATTHIDGILIAQTNVGGTKCSTAACHGTISAPAWGITTTNDSCTKCHGTGTVSVSTANREVVAPSLPAGTDTGNVSASAKTGAHQAHMLYSNGLTSVGTKDIRCAACHGALPASGTAHVNALSVPAFEGLATTSTGGTYATNYTPGAAPTCSVYCHNPAGSNGTLNPLNIGNGVTPAWTNAAYIANAPLKTVANCNKCHKSPWDLGFTSSYTHGVMTIANDCAGCHGHEGNTAGPVGQQHMDGIKYGSGDCDTCHGYPPVLNQTGMRGVVGNYESARTQDYTNGGGHHTGHLLSTVKQSDNWAPCLPCHPSGSHDQGSGTVLRANVQVSNDPAVTTYRFDSTRAIRYNTASLSCSNISCHFQPTPAW